jgi:penicillin-binding protein 1A
MYSEKGVYERGLSVRTTIDPELQDHAEKALIKGLLNYDKRHGWRGALGHISLDEDWQKALSEFTKPAELGAWNLAIVKEIEQDLVEISFEDGKYGEITFESMQWAKKFIDQDTQGPALSSPSGALKPGDIIAVSQTDLKGVYHLEQIPNVNGAIVAMDPYTGQVKAMVGGYYYNGSQFNRVIQAKRQPGSAFKPFVYLAALENGFTPNSIIVDEEIQLDRGKDMPEWRPQNHSGKYYGPTTIRVGVEKSRNAMTVRLAQLMGVEKIVDVVERFNISESPERSFALVLGATETTLLNLANGYASLVNGGKKIQPALVEYIQNSNGKVIYRRDNRNCDKCVVENTKEDLENALPPFVFDEREKIADPIASYQVTSILEGAVQRGTGRRARVLKRTVGGKTGTTNDSFDAWFLGFSNDLVCGVYVGFDTPRSLGKNEYGSSAALPIWVDFMGKALDGKPDVPFRRPDGIKLVKIDAETGLLPSPTTPRHQIIFEAFKKGTEPTTSNETSSSNIIESEEPDISEFGNEGVY